MPDAERISRMLKAVIPGSFENLGGAMRTLKADAAITAQQSPHKQHEIASGLPTHKRQASLSKTSGEVF